MTRTSATSFTVLACVFAAACCKVPAPTESSGGPSTGTPAQAPAPKAEPPPVVGAPAEVVDLQKLLADYKANEVRADGQYKGKIVELRGTVGDIKKDITGSPYVILTPHGSFVLPSAQCSFRDANQAMKLNKGDVIKVHGKVGGLMMNVQVRDCVVVN